MSTKKIKVKPEGREGVWIADKKSIIDFLIEYEFDEIHNLMHGSIITGANWDKNQVIEKAKEAERMAVLTGSASINNMNHALSLIVNNELLMFDIGEIKEIDLQILNAE